jgi:hypothetical protein
MMRVNAPHRHPFMIAPMIATHCCMTNSRLVKGMMSPRPTFDVRVRIIEVRVRVRVRDLGFGVWSANSLPISSYSK